MLEAMSLGLPVIGSNTEPVREVINDGSNGVLTDFFDENELAENVERLVRTKSLVNMLERMRKKQ